MLEATTVLTDWKSHVFLCMILSSVSADSITDIVTAACKRTPNLSLCNNSDTNAKNGHRKILFDRLKKMEEATYEENHLKRAYRTNEDSIPRTNKESISFTRSIANVVDRNKRNQFDDSEELPSAKVVETKKEDDVFEVHDDRQQEEENRVNNTQSNNEEGFIFESSASSRKLKEKETIEDENEDDDTSTFGGRREEYCDKYEQHFSFYCVGEIDQSGKYDEILSKFCPTYKKVCSHKQITSSISLTTWPQDPFSKEVTVQTQSEEHQKKDDDVTERQIRKNKRKQKYIDEMKRRFPCKPDCDERIFPHCTHECKCDYSYPAVQQFCNPPPLPLFLNTCRLWYNGCSKYAQYHYASQYIYSKAEKGKKISGPQINNPNPYNIPSPYGTSHISHIPVAADDPIREQPYSNNPQNYGAVIQSSDIPDVLLSSISAPSLNWSTVAEAEEMKRLMKRHNGKSNHSTRSTSYSSRVPQYYKQLRAINSLTTNLFNGARDPVSVLNDNLYQNEGTSSDDRNPRLYQVNTFPVIPSDAGSDANEDTFKQFDGLTDSSGVLHRPRSRSPFTKPGLWEPNPDNPHNRDHANKFFYYPRSVSADWLNGQIAWGAHWAVPAAGVGGTDGYSTVHFPTIGTFLNIPDDYD